MTKISLPGVEIRGDLQPGFEEILTPEAVGFIVELERRFGAERHRLLALAPSSRPDSTRARSPISSRTPPRSARPTGRSRRCPGTCSTAGSRSPVRSTAR
ncbi:MAG: hypothetical protein WDO24_04185 [Pseudomonadota bacterium]